MRHKFEEEEESSQTPNAWRLSSTPLNRETVHNEAQSYLARLAPLLYSLQTDDPSECERALKTVAQLRANGDRILSELEQTATPSDDELVTTFRAAVTQSGTIEEALRRRLAILRPGSPESRVDLASLRAGLAQVAARQELAETTGVTYEDEPRVEAMLSRSNWGSGLGMLLGALAMTAFVTVHATFLVGAFFHAVGPPALFLLLFYALFYAAAFGLLSNALSAISDQTLILEGNELIVRSKLGFWTREKRRTLGPNSRASVTQAQMRRKGQLATEIAVVDADGREFRIGRFVPEPLKQPTVERINRYVRRLGRR